MSESCILEKSFFPSIPATMSPTSRPARAAGESGIILPIFIVAAGYMPIILIASPAAVLVVISSGRTVIFCGLPSRKISISALGAPSAVRPEPIAMRSIIWEKSETFTESIATISSPAFSPHLSAGD